jgi:sugar transferase EpsL
LTGLAWLTAWNTFWLTWRGGERWTWLQAFEAEGRMALPRSQADPNLHGEGMIWRVPRRKRFLDLALGIPGLVVLLPVLGVSSLIVWICLGRPILFRQKRPGLGGRPFLFLKFRTLRDARDAQGNLLPDSERLTPCGHFLRSLSLDEWPSLINVLRGDMSLVGPRPLLMEYLDRYDKVQARRHEVLPGITGWAQIHGRNTLSWEQRFALDVWYVDHWSLGLDLKILLISVWKTLSREGVRPKEAEFTQTFMGKPSQEDPLSKHG